MTTHKRTLEVRDLAAGESYDLQVRAVNEEIGLPSNWSLTLNFTTDEDTQGPGNVALTNPDPLKAVAAAFRVTWNPVTVDGNGDPLDDLKDYRVKWIDTQTPSNTYTVYTEQTQATLTYQQNVEELGGVDEVTVEVVARDYANNVSATPSSATLQNVAATTFTGLTAARDSADSAAIAVEWPQPSGAASNGSDNGDDISYYEVWRDSVKIEDMAFAPGPTRYLDPDPRPGEHTYYVRAYDVYGVFIQSNSATATPIYADVGTDEIPPADPINVVATAGVDADNFDATSTYIDLAFDAPITNSDASPYLDAEGFVVRWTVTGSGNVFDRTFADTRADPSDSLQRALTTRIDGLKAGTQYTVSVAAFDTSKNLSNFVSGTATTAKDTTPPPTPAAPTASTALESRVVQISHDMLDGGGSPLPSDVNTLVIYGSTQPGFAVVDAMIEKRFSVSPGIPLVTTVDIPAEEVVTNQGNSPTWYFRARAIDSAGNISTNASLESSAVVNLISSANILNATINTAKVDTLDASVLTAGSAFVTELDIQNTMTVNGAGYIQSNNWDGNALGDNSTTGWYIGKDKIVINEGDILASSFTVIERNLTPIEFSTFLNNEQWYKDNLFTTGDAAGTEITADQAWYRYGFQSIVWTASALNDELYFGATQTDYNIQVAPSSDFIYSLYVYNPGVSDITVTPFVKGDDSLQVLGGPQVVPAGLVQRVSMTFTSSALETAVELGITNSQGAGTVMQIDGVQLEQVNADSDGTPGIFTFPAGTRISGSSITSGSLQSSLYDGSNGTNGFKIDLLGNAEFNEGIFRGDIRAETGYLKAVEIQDSVTINGGSMNADGTGGRIEIDETGLRFYDAPVGGNLKINMDTTGGNATFDGAITAQSGSIAGNLNVGANLIIDGGTSADVYLGNDIYAGTGTLAGINFDIGETGTVSNFWGRDAVDGRILFRVGEKATAGSYLEYDSDTGTVTIEGTLVAGSGSDIDGTFLTPGSVFYDQLNPEIRTSISTAWNHSFETFEFGDWSNVAGETLTQSTDAFSATHAGLFTSTLAAPASSGTIGSTSIEIPERTAVGLSGKRIRVSLYAKQPTTGASSQFAVAYSTNGDGDSGWQNFTPTASWTRFEFLYDIPAATAAGSDWLGIHGDTSGAGGGVLVDNLVIEILSPQITSSNVDVWLGATAIDTAYIANGAITNAKIENLAVDTAKIANLAVDTAQIASAAITTAKIGNLAVDTAQIANSAITNAKIDNLAVTTAKIADADITNGKIANLAVTTGKIADLDITTAKIANLQVTNVKIGNNAVDYLKDADVVAFGATWATQSAFGINNSSLSRASCTLTMPSWSDYAAVHANSIAEAFSDGGENGYFYVKTGIGGSYGNESVSIYSGDINPNGAYLGTTPSSWVRAYSLTGSSITCVTNVRHDASGFTWSNAGTLGFNRAATTALATYARDGSW